MKQYFTYNGKKAKGPYTINNLKDINIGKDTPIWYRGLPEWTTAEHINELKNIIVPYSQPSFIPHTNNRIAYKMAVVVAALIGMAVIYYSVNTPDANYTTAKSVRFKTK